MNKKIKIGIVFGTIAVAFLIILTLLPQANSNKRGQTQVAANLPLSGPLATYGVAIKEGATMGIEDLGGQGAPELSFDWQDNASEPKTAVTVLQKQLLNPIDVYVSGVKPQTMAIKDQVAAKGIPHFVWIFDANINRDSTNNFRTWVSYKIEPPIYLDYAKKRAARRVAIVYVQLPHTLEEFNDIVIPGLRKNGADQLLVEPFDFGKKDFKDIAAKFKDFNPDLILLNGFQGDLVGLVRALRPFGLITDDNTLATYDMLDAAKILGADELEGIRVVAPLFETRPERPEIKQWRQHFKDKFGKEPLYTHAFAYDMATIILDAGKRLKGPSDSAQWIEAIRTVNINGVTGPLKFDVNGDLVTPLEIGVYRAGKLTPLNP